jgi:phage replication-related protein YjqB (UPF0714/DUF867 family)
MSPHEDKYPNMRALIDSEREGKDYEIVRRAGRSGAAVIAPHGGGIEPGSCRIADAIASGDHSFYAFRGLKPTGNFDELHVTSTHFNEPKCRALIEHCHIVVAIHGCQDRPGKKGNDRMVFLGGRDENLRRRIEEHLNAARPKLQKIRFETGKHDDPRMQGTDPDNICNWGQGRRGVQLEMTKTLRTELTHSAAVDDLVEFSSAVRRAIES